MPLNFGNASCFVLQRNGSNSILKNKIHAVRCNFFQLVAIAPFLTAIHAVAQPVLVLSQSLKKTSGDKNAGLPPSPPSSERFTAQSAPALLRHSLDLSSKVSPPAVKAVRRALLEPVQPLIVTITINSEAKGEQIIYRSGKNNFFLKLEEINQLVTISPTADVFEIEGASYVKANALAGAKLEFDEKKLSLNISFPPEYFPNRVYSLAKGRSTQSVATRANSAVFNYRLGYTGASGTADGTLSLASEQTFNVGKWLLRNQNYHARAPEKNTALRYATQFIRDDREALQRLVIGDEITATGELGASVSIGGVSFSKAYQLAPYLVRQPSVNFAGAVALPSDVDFYVGNTRVLRQRVAPGPFEIANFNYYGGQRDVRVVIRDILGREQTIAYPFYFADQGLAQGLHDYSYHLGYLRENIGVKSNDYGKLAFSGFHRYGLTDSLTLGVRGEGTAQYGNFGPSLVFRSDALGLFSLNAAASYDRAVRKQSFGVSMAHSYQAGNFSSLVTLRRFGAAYTMLHAGSAGELPQYDFNVALGYSPSGFGSVNIGYNRLKLSDKPETRSATLSYSRAVMDRLSLLGTYRRALGGSSGYELFVGLQYLLGADRILSTSLRRDQKNARSEQMQFSNILPTGEGVAYRLGLERTRDENGSSFNVSPELQYSTRYNTVSAEVRSQSGSTTRSTTYSLAVAGGIAAVGGEFGFSRPINDSFGIAEITPPIAGVRVYQSSQEVGRTGENGKLFLPNLTSFVENYVSISDKDIPIEYAIERVDRIVSPSFRSGSVIKFSVVRTQSIVGALKYRSAGILRPLEYHLISLDVGGNKTTFPTGRNGDFYLENIAAGTYAASVQIGKTECVFSLTIPASSDAFIVLNEILTCDVAS